MLDAAGVRRELDSPLFVGGLRYAGGNALVEPGRLAWGLRRACLEAGVRDLRAHAGQVAGRPRAPGAPDSS